MQELHGLLAYERFVLREATRYIAVAAQFNEHNVVQVRERPNVFGKVMSFIQWSGRVAEQQRKLGLEMTLESDGWLYEAMADTLRYDRAIGAAFWNMRASGRRRNSSTYRAVRSSETIGAIETWSQRMIVQGPS